MGKSMLILKAFHIIFMVTWFAGLFYLPRLFVYHAETRDAVSLRRFEIMERRLFGIMSVGALLTVVSGLWLLGIAWWPLAAGWLQVKLLLVAGLLAYHVYCLRLMRLFREGRQPMSPRRLRWFNEVPALLLIAIVLLAVLKPF
jgi:putative membrane protein